MIAKGGKIVGLQRCWRRVDPLHQRERVLMLWVLETVSHAVDHVLWGAVLVKVKLWPLPAAELRPAGRNES